MVNPPCPQRECRIPSPGFAHLWLPCLTLALSLAACSSNDQSGDQDAGDQKDASGGQSDGGSAIDAGPACGNGVENENEVCDDGVTNSDEWSADGHCNASCSGLAAYCGDTALDGDNEACDDGSANSDAWALNAHCNATCTGQARYCGNDLVDDDAEACDDGTDNTDDWSLSAHCNAACTGNAAYCGDGAVTAGSESCDDSMANSDDWALTAHCNATCSAKANYCGDGILDAANESCDDGANNSDAWSVTPHCNAICTGLAEYCGDGTTNLANEACDEGTGTNSDTWSQNPHCNAACSGFAGFCGDDVVDAANETCDDGTDNNDLWTPTPHCDSTCSGNAPTCDLAEAPRLTLPRPGVPYPAENPHTEAKALVGKVLFWEEQLSSDNTVACGTCHLPSAGGSEGRSGLAQHPGPDGVLSTSDDVHGSQGIRRCQIVGGNVARIPDAIFGDDAQITGRKSPSFLDAMFAPDLFWDGRATSEFRDPDTGAVAIVSGGALESQAVGPPLSDVEMACEGRTWPEIHIKLATAEPLALASDLPADLANLICKYPSYPELMQYAFGDTTINTRRIAFSIATYERTLVSDQTPYDRYFDPLTPDLTAMTAAQVNGMDLIEDKASCVDCHPSSPSVAGAAPPFSDSDFHNVGFRDLDSETFPDLGLQNTTGLSTDEGKFKTPTLRNVGGRELGGLAHGGRFGNLEDIMNAYNLPPVPPGPGSSTDDFMIPLNLTGGEIANIVDFLRNALADPRVSNETYPFDRPTLGSE